jgi:hypothetical protein
MSLDINHGCFSGEVAAFDSLRIVWSIAAGYGVRDFTSLGGPVIPNIAYDQCSDEDLLGEWPRGAPDDPLIIVLVHDEKHGRIKHAHCALLADRLEEIEAILLKNPGNLNWLLMTQQFIRGLRFAAQSRQDVVFT